MTATLCNALCDAIDAHPHGLAPAALAFPPAVWRCPCCCQTYQRYGDSPARCTRCSVPCVRESA